MLARSLHSTRAAALRVQRLMPPSVRYALKRVYHGTLLPLSYAMLARQDPAILTEHGLEDAPPPVLRHRVHGAADLASFLTVGRQVFEHIRAGLEMAGQPVTATTAILDFGCGSGRNLLWWSRQTPRPRLFGTDIDREAIGWVATHLPVETNVNQLAPPLPYDDGQMDAVYSISVLTHLDEAAQDAWLAEIRRVVRPGGVALLSVHSAESNAMLSAADQATLAATGFLFRMDYSIASKVFGNGYRNTYHSAAYIDAHWLRYFQIIGRIGMGRQDLIVMRREG